MLQRAINQLLGRGGSREPQGEAAELRALRPRIVPTSYFEAGLPGPRVDLVLPGFALSWVLLLAPRSFRSVTDEMVERWTAADYDWPEIALAHLRPRGESDRRGAIFTKYEREPDGTLVSAIAHHADGLGPARLLLHEDLARRFPAGYRVALPDMQVGMALSNAANAAAFQQFSHTAERFWACGGAPLSAGLFAPSMLRLRGAPQE